MPWSHLLPDYARSAPHYGQNLVEIAAALKESDPDTVLRVLDVGANIGDSAAQVIARTGGEVLAVEADPYWLRYLKLNIGEEQRATIVGALLVNEGDDWGGVAPLRIGGSTSFAVQSEGGGALPSIPVAELRARHPEFDALRLVKSDTDGFDAILVPAIAEVWRDAGPVLFFEWIPALARLMDAGDPDLMWPKLEALGYTRLAIWDNEGTPLGQLDIRSAATMATTLELGSRALGYSFWDVAARREDDEAAAAVFDRLVPQPFAVVPAAAR